MSNIAYKILGYTRKQDIYSVIFSVCSYICHTDDDDLSWGSLDSRPELQQGIQHTPLQHMDVVPQHNNYTFFLLKCFFAQSKDADV